MEFSPRPSEAMQKRDGHPAPDQDKSSKAEQFHLDRPYLVSCGAPPTILWSTMAAEMLEVDVSMRDAFELEPITLFGETVIAALADR